MAAPAFFAPLRQPRFTRYMAGESISMVGTWTQMFAQGWVLTSLTSSALMLAGINFTAGIPMLLLTLVGGSFADRFDKRRILYGVLAVQILSACALGFLIAEHRVAIWHVFVTALILGIATAFEVPTVAALVPELVSPEEIGGAIAFDRASFHFTRLLGPAVGGWLIGRFGAAPAYFFNALTFFALIAALLTIGPRQVGTPEEEERRGTGIGAGFAFVKRDHPIRSMILLMTCTTLFVSPFLMILMPLYSRITLGLPAQSMGILMGISGIGSFAGSLGLLTIPRGFRALCLKCAAGAIALALAGLGLAPTLVPACASIVCLALGLSTTFGLANIVIQERAPDHLRGRVSAIASMSFFSIVPFSGLLISAGVDSIGMRPAMLSCAGGFAVCAALLLARVHRLSSAPSDEAVLELASR